MTELAASHAPLAKSVLMVNAMAPTDRLLTLETTTTTVATATITTALATTTEPAITTTVATATTTTVESATTTPLPTTTITIQAEVETPMELQEVEVAKVDVSVAQRLPSTPSQSLYFCSWRCFLWSSVEKNNKPTRFLNGA